MGIAEILRKINRIKQIMRKEKISELSFHFKFLNFKASKGIFETNR